MSEQPPRPVYVLKITPLHGDGIHELRALLKRLLRPHQWRCVSVERASLDPIKAAEFKSPCK
jgi:hypothetical protein